MTLVLRPRSTGELIDAAFQLLRQQYAQFVTVTAVPFAPVLLVYIAFPMRINWLDPEAAPDPSVLVGSVLGGLLSVLAQVVAFAGIVELVGRVYAARTPDAGAALRDVWARFWTVLGASLLWMLLVFGAPVLGAGLLGGLGAAISPVVGVLAVLAAFALAMLALLLLAGWYFAVIPAVVIEHRAVIESFRRSRALVDGSLGRAILILAGVYLLYLFISTAIGGLLAIVLLITQSSFVVAMTQVLGTLAQILLFPIVGIVATMLYFDLRIRKEGFDLEMMAGELSSAGAPPP